MPLLLSNKFIYLCFGVLTILFATGLNDISITANFLETNSIDTRLIVMFLLAEPHFAMTLPLLYGYRKNFIEKKTWFLFIPFLIIILASIVFFNLPNLFFLIFLAANVYHVNRQSVGFLKLQAKYDLYLSKVYEILLHSLTFTCLYFALINKSHSLELGLIIFIIFLLLMIVFSKFHNNSFPSVKDIFIISQGFLIFLPIIIFKDLLMAFAVGISIHYIQYLAISWRVLTKGFGYSMLPIFSVLLFYSLITTGALSGVFTQERISLIVFIPTLLQLLHFYYDGLIWRRNDLYVADTMKKALS